MGKALYGLGLMRNNFLMGAMLIEQCLCLISILLGSMGYYYKFTCDEGVVIFF